VVYRKRFTVPKLIYGFGTNDAGYQVRHRKGKKYIWKCPYYYVWTSMLYRCYCSKQESYQKCKVCSEWATFSNFKFWMEPQDWEDKHLDKDVLGNGKLYSPTTCCFVPRWLNNLMPSGKTGVVLDRRDGRFQARLTINGNRISLGRFDRETEAHGVYCSAKLNHIQNLMVNYPDQRIKQAVLQKAKVLYEPKGI